MEVVLGDQSGDENGAGFRQRVPIPPPQLPPMRPDIGHIEQVVKQHPAGIQRSQGADPQEAVLRNPGDQVKGDVQQNQRHTGKQCQKSPAIHTLLPVPVMPQPGGGEPKQSVGQCRLDQVQAGSQKHHRPVPQREQPVLGGGDQDSQDADPDGQKAQMQKEDRVAVIALPLPEKMVQIQA